MSLGESRGGWPHVFRESIPTSGRMHRFPFVAKYLQMRATTNTCKVYFTEADYDNDENYVLVPVPAAETPHGEWCGPAECHTVWLKAVTAASTLELVAYQRRA